MLRQYFCSFSITIGEFEDGTIKEYKTTVENLKSEEGQEERKRQSLIKAFENALNPTQNMGVHQSYGPTLHSCKVGHTCVTRSITISEFGPHAGLCPTMLGYQIYADTEHRYYYLVSL